MMHFAEEEILIAFLDSADFQRARCAIEEFQEHETYEDYRYDREGRLMGLAFAGQKARLVAVSIDPFLSWSASTRRPPTAAQLDAFAALVETFRRDPQARPRPVLASGSRSASAPPSGSFGVPVDLPSYEDWLECIGERPSNSLLEAYAGLVVETWKDDPRASILAD